MGIGKIFLIFKKAGIVVQHADFNAVLFGDGRDLFVRRPDLRKASVIVGHCGQNVDLCAVLANIPAGVLPQLARLFSLHAQKFVIELIRVHDGVCTVQVALLKQAVCLFLAGRDFAVDGIPGHIQGEVEDTLLQLLDLIQKRLPLGGNVGIGTIKRGVAALLVILRLHGEVARFRRLQLFAQLGKPAVVAKLGDVFNVQHMNAARVHLAVAHLDGKLLKFLELEVFQNAQLDGIDAVKCAVIVVAVDARHKLPQGLFDGRPFRYVLEIDIDLGFAVFL